MVQYLTAVWDYAAEGQFELSFKQGDKIKLLEKHNDDWWEGELNDEIGFFPANRVKLETEPDNHVEQPKLESNAPAALAVPSRSSIEQILPRGWQHAYDESGTIYFFNEHTGESRWERPDESLATSLNEPEDATLQLEKLALSSTEPVDLDPALEKLSPSDLKKLELSQLQPQWIKYQGFVQMKMTTEKEGEKLSSWKVYYAVLSNAFLLLYKDSYSKQKKYAKPLVPVGSFDLESCHIAPAEKNDTKRKHVFLVTTAKGVTVYVQTPNEKELSSWLDAIMRGIIARREGVNEDTDIMRLLHLLTSESHQMKVNRKMSKRGAAKDGDTRPKPFGTDADGKPKKLGAWFNKSSKDHEKLPTRPIAGSFPSSASSDDIFGGFLRMEDDGSIPRVVQLCVQEVEARGLTSVGIYRLSGPASSIQRYRTLFNNKEKVSFAEEADINVITGVLKLYFRELRNPLLTHEYYDWFIDAARIPDYDERMFRIKSIIHVLPKPNFVVLEYLMRHLHNIAMYSETNKMEASNLALIFSVGILRSPQEDFSSIMHTDLQSKVVEAIIQQVDWFFEEDEEDDVPLVEQ